MNKSDFTSKRKILLQDLHLIESMLASKRQQSLELIGYSARARIDNDQLSAEYLYLLDDLLDDIKRLELTINKIKGFPNAMGD